MSLLPNQAPENTILLLEDLYKNLNERYKYEYPIIWCQKNLNVEERISLPNLLQQNNFLNYFANSENATEFIQKLTAVNIGFILIVSTDYDEQVFLRDFESLEKLICCKLTNHEEELLFKKLFESISALDIMPKKAYRFFSMNEFENETPVDEEDEEVFVVKEVEKMGREFREELLIWYDSNLNPSSIEEFKQSLKVDKESVLPYNFEQFSKKISDFPDFPYHLILTKEDQAAEILKNFGGSKGLLLIYACPNDDAHGLKISNPKVKDLPKNLEELIPIVLTEIKARTRLDLPAFITTSDACDKQHIHDFHMFLKNLSFTNRTQAKIDFNALARQVCLDKDTDISGFERNYQDYNREKILYWYSKESPVNKLTNNCIRIQTPDSLTYARFTIKDLERAIREHYQKESKNFFGVVYRAAIISQDEWAIFQRDQGQEIEMLGFLSTTKKESKAKEWVYYGLKTNAMMMMVEIIIPPLLELDPQGFADITKISYFPEEEILFNVRSRFQIVKTEVRKDYRHVTLLYDPSLSSYIMRNKPSSRIKIKFPSELEQRCQNQGCPNQDNLFFEYQKITINCERCLLEKDKANSISLEENSFNGDLNILHPHTRNQGWKCDECGAISMETNYRKQNAERNKSSHKNCFKCLQQNKKRKLDFSLEAEKNPKVLWLKDNYDYEMAKLDFRHSLPKDSNKVSQGDLYFEVKKYPECLEYCEKKLSKILTKRREQERLRLYDLIGKSSKHLSLGEKAKEYLFKHFIATESIFGEEHQETAISSHNLAILHLHLNRDYGALAYSAYSLKVIESFDKERSIKTVEALTTLAVMHMISDERNKNKAIKMFKKAIDITLKMNGKIHLNTTKAYKNLSIACQNLGKNLESIQYLKRALSASPPISTRKSADKAVSFHLLAIFRNLVESANFQDKENAEWKLLRHLVEINFISLLSLEQMKPMKKEFSAICENLGKIQKGLENFLQSHDSRRLTSKKDNESFISLFMGLRNMYLNFGKNGDSKNCFEKASKFTEFRQEDHEERLTDFEETHTNVHDNLAMLYKSLGKYLKAVDYSNKALDMTKFSYGRKHAKTAFSYNQLALIHHNFQEYEKAFPSHWNALIIQESFSEKNSPDLIAYYNDLALTFEYSKEYWVALFHRKNALEISISAYTENHAETASSYSNIAILYEKLERYQKAEKFYIKACRIIKSLCGEDHFDFATLLNNIASIKLRLAQYSKAFSYFSKAFKVTKSIKGEKHQNIGASHLNLAKALRKQTKHKEELEHCQKALEIFKPIYGENHSTTANSFNDIARAYSSLGDFKRAEYYHTMALKISNSLHVLKHPKIAASFNNLANVYCNQKNMQEALTFFLRAFEITISIYGNEHSETVSSFNNLAFLYRIFEDYRLALEYAQEALNITRRIYGEEHPETALSYHTVAEAYQKKGKEQEALAHFEKAFEICTSPQDHPPYLIATISQNLGSIYADPKNQEKLRKACKLFQKAADIKKRCLGEDHPETKACYHNLTYVKRLLGEHMNALEDLKKAEKSSIQKLDERKNQKKFK